MADELRLQIVDRLVEMAESTVDLDFSAVFNIALGDATAAVRQKAVLGLWESEERSLISVYIGLLRSDPSEDVRGAAALALGNFAALAEDGKLLPKDYQRIKGSLVDAINDTEQPIGVRRRALEAVGAMSDDDVVHLIWWAYAQPEEEFRRSAVFAMARNASPHWLTTILKELESDDPAMRYESACACGELSDEDAVSYLLPLLQDDDDQVALATIAALGNIGGSAARSALNECANSEDGGEAIVEAATAALAALDTSNEPVSFKNRL